MSPLANIQPIYRSVNAARISAVSSPRGAETSKEHDVRAAYVHLPFCKRRCFYCDFPVQAIGPDPAAAPIQDAMQQYVKLVCQEITATASIGSGPLQTVFFGGGTPSLTPPYLIEDLIKTLDSQLGIANGAEISMEADPGTFDAARLRSYMALGVSRFSIGVQAFQQDVLEFCGRSHSLDDVHAALSSVKEAAVADWSLDLISGLPLTDLPGWQHSLCQALLARPPHISVYDLQVEEGTRFGRLHRAGKIELPPSEAAADMYAAASQILRAAGYQHYEVSSYALPGHRCAHNCTYWSGEGYYAFGVGAASYLRHRRFSRPRSMAAYRTWVSNFRSSRSRFPGGEEEPDSAEEQLLDRVMLGLRLGEGLELGQVAERFGKGSVARIRAALAPHVAAGKAHEGGGRVWLADPEGFLVSNTIISDVFAELDGWLTDPR